MKAYIKLSNRSERITVDQFKRALGFEHSKEFVQTLIDKYNKATGNKAILVWIDEKTGKEI